MNIKKTLVSSAVAVGLSMGVAAFSTAQAGALATSVVVLENFTLSQGGTILDASDFNSLTFSSSADTIAGINGSLANDSSAAAPNFSSDLFSQVGASTYTDNDFSVISSAGGFPTGNFAIGDQLESGSPASGFFQDASGAQVAAGTPGAIAVGTGANLSNASYVSIEASGAGSAASNNGLEAKFQFTGISGSIDLDFGITAYLEAFLDIGNSAPSTASASFSVIFSLVEDGNAFGGNLILNNGTSANGSTNLGGTFAQTGAANAPGSGIGGAFGFGPGIPFVDAFTLHTADLDATKTYQLSARILTAADATAVPEPSTLALMGLSLLGFTAMRKFTAK